MFKLRPKKQEAHPRRFRSRELQAKEIVTIPKVGTSLTYWRYRKKGWLEHNDESRTLEVRTWSFYWGRGSHLETCKQEYRRLTVDLFCK